MTCHSLTALSASLSLVVVSLAAAQDGARSRTDERLKDQRRIVREGHAYLQSEYPKLDFIRRATIDP
jgi:hypothetical protein